jgi:stage II sporulation protein D
MRHGHIAPIAATALLLIASDATTYFAETTSTQAAEKTTLRVGFWTLWHDHTVTFSAAGTNARMATCESCEPVSLTTPLKISADGEQLVVEDGAGQGSSANAQAQHQTQRQRHESTLFISGSIQLSAHGESETPRLPMEITAHKGQLVLAATLPVELYVERVVASESSSADSAESLRALAIVVRTFALHQRHGHTAYDLCDSTHCQLLHWHGNPSRAAAAHAATLATAGETLWFHGARASAWFHQDCGGETARPEEIWPVSSHAGEHAAKYPYLTAQMDPYCTASGTRTWATTLTRDELTTALARAGLVAPGWKRLSIAHRGEPAKGESPRVHTLRADQTEISAEDFRLAVGQAFGWNRILSTWFDMSVDGESYHFSGRGSGHGVGLCQAGAAAMSASGQTRTQILAQYFPNAEARDESTGRVWSSQQIGELTIETLSAEDAAKVSDVATAFNDAKTRAGSLYANAHSTQLHFTVRGFPSTTAFRNATLAPGWVAAFTEGNWIGTQPLATLSARKLLRPILRHEFLHAIVEAQAAPSTPLWLREGFVELIANDGKQEANESGAATPTLDELNKVLKTAQSEAESSRAHKIAAQYASRLIQRYNRAQVESWLRTGLPDSAAKSITQSANHR